MKVAISVPDPLFAAAERLAASMRKPRSHVYAEALAMFVKAHSPDDVTARLNTVHGAAAVPLETALHRAQLATLPDEAW